MKMKVGFFSYPSLVNTRMAHLFAIVDPREIEPILFVIGDFVISKKLAQPLVLRRKPVYIHPHAAQEGISSQQEVVNHCFIFCRGTKRTYLKLLARHVLLSDGATIVVNGPFHKNSAPRQDRA